MSAGFNVTPVRDVVFYFNVKSEDAVVEPSDSPESVGNGAAAENQWA